MTPQMIIVENTTRVETMVIQLRVIDVIVVSISVDASSLEYI